MGERPFTAPLASLLRRTGHCSVAAVHAAVTGFGLQHQVATCTFIEADAGVARHLIAVPHAAMRTVQGGEKERALPQPVVPAPAENVGEDGSHAVAAKVMCAQHLVLKST